MNLTARRINIRSLPRDFQSHAGLRCRISPVVGELQQRLLQMYLAAPRGSFQGLPPQGDAQCGKWIRDMTRSAVNIVAVAPDGSVIGHAGILPVDDRHCQLMVMVRWALRNQGIGTQLTEAAIVAAAEAGFEQIWLPVEPDNHAAQRLFQRCGVQTVVGETALSDAPIRMEMDLLPLASTASPVATTAVAMPHFLQLVGIPTSVL